MSSTFNSGDPVRISFNFYGDQQVDRVLDRIADNVENATPAFEAIADRFAAAEQQQFASQGGFGGGGWAPLSPAYAAWKASRYPGGILVRTGALKGSLTSRPFGVETISNKQAVFGTAVAYAGYHQSGTSKMPARPPVQLPESERAQWVKIMQRFIVTGSV